MPRGHFKELLTQLLFMFVACILACSNDSRPANGQTPSASNGSPSGAARMTLVAAKTKSLPPSGASPPKTKFRPYEVIDQQENGMVVSRLAVPEGWRTSSRVNWNLNDFYLPVHVSARTESPDGSSWVEFFPAEIFVWLDPMHDRAPIGRGGIGGIHDPNITLERALVRYVIAPNRENAKNLRILGSRPVNDLPKAFARAFQTGTPQGQGICMRVQYELNGTPVDEEFYAFMPKADVIPSGRMVEYHQPLLLAHSMGAKAGKLESVRPLLGFMATSIEPNPAWQQRFGQIKKMQGEYYQRVMAANYAEIRNAGEMSRANAARSDQFLRHIDASLAVSRAQQAPPQGFSPSSNDDFYKRADAFDQNIRGTEHLQDQYGQVTDQYTDYNYHWTDGFGRYVHTDDPNLDPNKYLNGNYQLMTPPPR